MQGYLELEEVIDARAAKGFGGRFYGAYPALVRDVRDPDNQGRVKVALPWSPDPSGASYETWARVSTLMAGNNQGTWFIPDTNVEVLVIFLGGDPRNPCVIGALWNGQDAPPQSMDGAGNNNIKKIRSRNGVAITIDDTQGSESLTLETPGGQKIALQDGPGSILIQDSNGNSIKLDSSGITLTASAKVSISASQAEATAGMVSVNAGMSKFSGVVNSDTVITNSVVSASYTPGAGNIW
ncbi:MAG TPA: phage baseplate assembly protein V [Candidatus Acidoferrales bacterium]|nr:phage baseplate assembly protein V [Candidatus Acidoferrales bacterium]